MVGNKEDRGIVDSILEELKAKRKPKENKFGSTGEIIDNYNKLKAEGDTEEAISFILREFQGEWGNTLNKKYLILLMLDDGGNGYDPINKILYCVDPEVKNIYFEYRTGEFILFCKEQEYSDPETYKSRRIRNAGLLPDIQKLRVIGSEEISKYPLDAYVYDQKHAETLRQLHRETIEYANLRAIKQKPL